MSNRFKQLIANSYRLTANFLTRWYIRFRMRPYLLDKAIKEANRLHKQNGKRYRVFFFGYKYRVWTREDIKERKRIKLFKDNLKCGADFDSICFYDTAKQ